MNTRSIILSPHEVRAALRGELGLVVRPVNGLGDVGFTNVRFSSLHSLWGPDAWIFEKPMDKDATGYEAVSRGLQCPLGVPGTRLVCREPYFIQDTHGQHRADGLRWGSWSGLPTTISSDGRRIVYYKEGFDRSSPMWLSPTTMPAWASRITLEVVSLGVGRLGDITEADANMAGDLDDLDPTDVCATANRYGLAMDDGRASFACAWNARYAKRGLGWDTSPWVWKAAVRRVKS